MDRAANLRASLARLALAPPQTMLFEGGTEKDRLDLALYWAKTVNCPVALAQRAANQPAIPCGECVICRQIQANENIDLLIYDGRIGNKQDEEKPGPIRALRIENMRELKALNGTAPHGEGKRVAIFQGMSQTREEALNSLLKTLEEPSEHTLFALLAPQRQQLLPTLVSRSFCLTLPWRDCLTHEQDLDAVALDLAQFLQSGRGFLDKIAQKGAVDMILAGRLLLMLQRSLIRVLAAKGRGELDGALAPLAANPAKVALFTAWLNEAQAMLMGTVTPARVLEAFCSRLFSLLQQTRYGELAFVDLIQPATQIPVRSAPRLRIT